MAEIKVFGYTDKLSVKPGDKIDFHVSADGTKTANAQLVRLIHGDEHPNGPGYMDEEVDCELNGVWNVKKQFTQLGSFLKVEDPNNHLAIDGDFTVFGYINPSTPHTGAHQWIFCRWNNKTNEGYGIGINKDGHLELVVGDGKEVDYLVSELPMVKKIWYFVAATFNYKTKEATLYQEGVVNRYNSLLGKVVPYDYRSHTKTTFRFKQKNNPKTPFIVAGSIDNHELRGDFVSGTFAGKVDRHGVCNKVLSKDELDKMKLGEMPPKESIVAYWDTTEGYNENGISNTVIDIGPNKLNSVGYNHPVRAMTGWNWSGKNDCFRLAPKEYGGIDFHPDSITDAKWDVTNSLVIPDNLKSGAYAMKLKVGTNGSQLSEEYIVFFVRAKVPKAKICFLFPTASYLAYANEKLSFEAQIIQPMTGQPPTITDIDVEQYKNPEFGLSTYDSYADGGGVCFTSYRRPVLNMRPKYRTSGMGITWQFPADLSIIGWLEHHYKDEYEILTDEDVHLEGIDALKPYSCVISGTHPEYTSEKMLDAFEDYVADINNSDIEPNGKTQKGLPKGCTLTYRKCDELKCSYLYPELFLSDSEYQTWISENKEKIKNEGHEFVEAKWWYIERYECTLVKRDREWWAQTMEKIYTFNKEVEYYKVNGVEELKQKINGNKPRGNKPYGNKPFDISSVDECLL